MGTAVDFHANWGRIRERIRAKVGRDIFASWFERMECECASDSHVELSVPTRFLRSWIRSHYLDLLTGYWREMSTLPVSVDIVVRGSSVEPSSCLASNSNDALARTPAGVPHRAAASDPIQIGERSRQAWSRGSSSSASESAGTFHPAPAVPGVDEARSRRDGGISPVVPALYQSSPVDPHSTFETFVVSDSNRLAYAAVHRVALADPNAPVEFNPLLVYADVGLGKSHLLQAAVQAVRRSDPQRRVLYLTAERFVYGFVSALRQKVAIDFKGGLQATDILLIDDVQFLQGKTVQREFCHMLNALIDNSRQIIVAADCAAPRLENLDERVRSRLNGGVSLEIGPLCAEQRRQILRNRAQESAARYPGFDLPEDALSYMAEKVVGSGRDLEGAFNRLLAFNQLTGTPITLDVAERTVVHVLPVREPRRIMVEEIQKAVATHFNVSRSDLLSARRTRSVVRPRQIAMYLSKVLTPRSLPEIGRRFGGRDHTTVMHAVRKVEEIMDVDSGLAQEIGALRRRLER